MYVQAIFCQITSYPHSSIGERRFSSPKHADRLRGPPSFLTNRYRGFILRAYSHQSVKLTTSHHLVPSHISIPLYAFTGRKGTPLPLPLYATHSKAHVGCTDCFVFDIFTHSLHIEIIRALFRDFIQHGMAIPYRRFGATYQCHLQG